MTAEPLETRVTNGRFVGPDAPAAAELTIHNGQILAPTDHEVWRTVDASGHLVFPGLIQPSGIAREQALPSVRAGVTTAMADPADHDAACLDWIHAVEVDIPIVAPDAAGTLTDDGWDILTSSIPAHFQAPAGSGFPLIHFLYHEGHLNRGMTLDRIAEITSGCLASAFGIFPGKGSFSVGSDGDLVVFDPESHDPYSDILWPGRVIFSLLRGNILLYNGQIHTSAGDGQRIQ